MATCLGIETSCDETAAAVIESASGGGCRILSEAVSSQVKIHELYGGVVPELASREHLANLPLILERVLLDAGVTLDAVDVIGVTRGPGLKGCLLMGVSFAKALALASSKPLIGVNHLEGHLHAAFLTVGQLEYPFLALIVSGGHTEIALVRELGRYEIISRTSDDAAGEAFDKSANLLGFGYPGGACLARIADSVRGSRFKLPRVMRDSPGFSFSGLKTAISLLVRDNRHLLSDASVRAEVCFAVQEAIVAALVDKLEQAIENTGVSTVVLSGGVSANRLLRERVSGLCGVRSCFPAMQHCMDNGAMIAYVAMRRHACGAYERSLGFEAMSRWAIEEIS